MSTTNQPSASHQTHEPRKSYKGLIIGLLTVGLLGSWGYLIFNQNKSEQAIKQQETKIAQVTTEKSDLQKNFDATLARLDSLSGYNNELQGKLSASSSEINRMKTEIRSILNKRNATAAELNRAKELIEQLNQKVNNLEEEIARLTQENETLGSENVQLTQERERLNQELVTTTAVKQELEQKVDVASTLNASNIVVTPLNVKKNGKEKVSTTAKRVDKLVISFDVDNRIAQSGPTELYVCITGPDGKPVADQTLGSGTFTTREEGDKLYTAKVPVDFEAEKKKKVEFAWKPGSNFQKGVYTIEIYQNGFKIGESTRQLKKGGLFS